MKSFSSALSLFATFTAIRSVLGNSVIHPGASGNKCLTAASNADGAPVTIDDCQNGPRQTWTYSGGVLHVFDNKCLDVTNGGTNNGNKMQIYTCHPGNTNQKFSYTGDHRIAWTNKGECLDLTNGSLQNGNVIQMWKCTDNNNNQVWNIVPKPTSSSSMPSSSSMTTTTTKPAGTAKLIKPGKSDQKCLTASSDSNNAAVTIEDCNNTPSPGQKWTYTGGSLHIYDNKCLDVTNGGTQNGNKMQIYTCVNGNTNQQFSYTGDKRIAWTNKGECLDLTNGSLNNGNVIQMWKCTDNNSNQVWNMV